MSPQGPPRFFARRDILPGLLGTFGHRSALGDPAQQGVTPLSIPVLPLPIRGRRSGLYLWQQLKAGRQEPQDVLFHRKWDSRRTEWALPWKPRKVQSRRKRQRPDR